MNSEVSKYLASLHDDAEIQIDTGKPLKLYLRSADLVYKQVLIIVFGITRRVFIEMNKTWKRPMCSSSNTASKIMRVF